MNIRASSICARVVILEAAQNVPGIVLDPGVLQSAIGGAYQVLHQIGPTEAGYLTLDRAAGGRRPGRQIPAVFAEAASACRRSPPRSGSANWRSGSRRNRGTALLRHCVRLVRQSGDDRALRSELVQMIIGAPSLNCSRSARARRSRNTRRWSATAAWIADGVPEAEDFVRAHRMWASNADQPVFGGNWQWRAFFGLITLFVALPLLNSSMAKPAWQVLLAGPSLAETDKRKGAPVRAEPRLVPSDTQRLRPAGPREIQTAVAAAARPVAGNRHIEAVQFLTRGP